MSGSGDEDLYVADFEHSITGRDIPVWLERDFHMIGVSYLILSVNGSQIYSGVDTVEGMEAMRRDLETLKHHIAMAQKALRERLDEAREARRIR